jgi:hypothetical protein
MVFAGLSPAAVTDCDMGSNGRSHTSIVPMGATEVFHAALVRFRRAIGTSAQKLLLFYNMFTQLKIN